jgi:putative transposase
MPINPNYLADFEEDGIYHVYNRTNNGEPLFLTDENRYFFLKKYKEYLAAYIDTYCWCLLPNHFHFLIRVKPEKQIRKLIQQKASNECTLTEAKFLENTIPLSELIQQGFKRFFQSYSLAFNKMHHRKGNLFYRPFKRVKIQKETHFTNAIIYIHANPVKHRLATDFTHYKWSSWQTYLSIASTDLLREEVLDWFGQKEQMIKAHYDLSKYYYDCDVSIED